MTAEAGRQRLGGLLVTLQFLLIAWLMWLGLPAFVAMVAPAGAWACAALSLMIGAWALWANRPGNFNIRPNPRTGAHLVRQGPYRWIRHPMYTAVMTAGVASAWASYSSWTWVVLVALVAVLVAKAALEERWMLQAHEGYAAYKQDTRWFLPWIA